MVGSFDGIGAWNAPQVPLSYTGLQSGAYGSGESTDPLTLCGFNEISLGALLCCGIHCYTIVLLSHIKNKYCCFQTVFIFKHK